MITPIIEWPDGVPSCIEPLSPQGGLRDNRLSFDTDSRMPPIERPLTSWTPEQYYVDLVPMSIDQFSLFQEWYKRDLRYGVYPFVFSHPITRAISPWKIIRGEPPYRVSKIGTIPMGSGRRRIRVSFTISSWAGSISPVYVAQESSDLVLQETGDRIIYREGYSFRG